MAAAEANTTEHPENVDVTAVDDSRETDLEELVARLDKYVSARAKREFASYKYADLDDVTQTCWETIIRQYGRYTPAKGMLTTYYNNWLIHAFASYKNYLAYGGETSHYCKNANAVRSAISRLEDMDINPAPEKIAAITGLSYANVQDALAVIHGSQQISLDQVDDLEYTATQADSAEEVFFDQFYLRQLIAEAMRPLDDKTRQAVTMYYGLDGGAPMTYHEIADRLDIRPDAVRERISYALRYLGGDSGLRAYVNKQ